MGESGSGYWCMSFAGVPKSITAVRIYLTNLLGESAAYESVLLIASELATNAIRHSLSGSLGGQFVLRVNRSSDRVGIQVDDLGGPNVPRISASDDLRTSGRGLVLVAALSLDWGVRGDERSRTVWAETAIPANNNQSAIQVPSQVRNVRTAA